MSEGQKEIAARLVKSGMKSGEVAAEMGISYKHATNVISRARSAGLLPPVQASIADRTRGKLRERGIVCGSIGDVLNALTPDVADWLEKQAVDGASLAELFAGFITDAYHEENPDA